VPSSWGSRSRADEGLTLAQRTLVRPDRLTAAGRALLHTDTGRALAKMRRVGETLTAIGTADEHFTHFTPKQRAADELRELAHYAAAHQHLDEVAHLRHRLAILVCTGSP